MKNDGHLNTLWARSMIEELVRNGVTIFTMSPGSRSTPLTVAVAENDRARAIVHFDERAAAFHALGAARSSGRPAALVCTSGTAAANYFPAVVEASQSTTPLILLTADRPPELQDCGANQTVDQQKLFGSYLRWQFNLPCPDTAMPLDMALTTIDQACHRAQGPHAGPVHLNCAFREPLAPTEPSASDLPSHLRNWQGSTAPYTTYTRPRYELDTRDQSHLINEITQVRRGLLIIGSLRTVDERVKAAQLAIKLGWPTFPDVSSSLRLGTPSKPWIHYYDHLLLSEPLRAHCVPEMILHVGGSLVSKRLGALIEERRNATYIKVDSHPRRDDPHHAVDVRVQCEVGDFCEWLRPTVLSAGATEWSIPFNIANAAAHEAIGAFVRASDQLSEIAVARTVSRHAPDRSQLFLASSMPVRDMDMYGEPVLSATHVIANRGASGIDGSIATAAGMANGAGRLVTAIVGDLAALHDLGSFALLRNTSAPVILVVVNNNGGGIFHFLPVAQAWPNGFEPFFGTPHGLNFKRFSEGFGLPYAQPRTRSEFEEVYTAVSGTGESAVIEVITDRIENLRLHQQLQAMVASGIDAALSNQE